VLRWGKIKTENERDGLTVTGNRDNLNGIPLVKERRVNAQEESKKKAKERGRGGRERTPKRGHVSKRGKCQDLRSGQKNAARPPGRRKNSKPGQDGAHQKRNPVRIAKSRATNTSDDVATRRKFEP